MPNTSLELIKQIPLEDRLASLFQNFRLGDLILVGKNLQDCAKKMYKNANLVQNAIKRSFYIADDKIGGSLGFIKNSSGDTEVINLNDFEIPLISGNKTYPLKPQESFYVIPEDVLSVDGNLLKIKDEPKTNLSMYRKNFARAFDYEKEVKQNLETLNKKTLSKLMKTDHKGTSAVTFAEVGGYQELKDTLKKDSPAVGDIAMSVTANALGLTNAATPIGLKVMKELQEENPNKEKATDAMCMFLGMNTAGFQIIPATVIAVLVGAGASNPTDIILPTLIVTTLSFLTAITAAIILRKIWRED